MHPFSYRRPGSLDEAIAMLAPAPVDSVAGATVSAASPLGGGTDLLLCIKESLARPDAVVDLTRIPGFAGVYETASGGLRIGGGTRVAAIAANEVIRARYAALAEAADQVGTVALRHMGTLGGNICQRPRCWYFRRLIPCLKNGGSGCPAHDGENQYHAIIGGGPCWIVHPSDPAVALVALDAVVNLRGGPHGARTVAASNFFVLPTERLDRETCLEDGEIVESVELPATSASSSQQYVKIMQRGAWDFALVSLAAVLRTDGDVRLVLGGVAPAPWRVASSVEEDVAAGSLDDDSIEALAERALYDASPLSKNAYKVTIARTLLRRAISWIGAKQVEDRARR